MTVNGEVRRSKFRKKITRKKCASAPFMMMEQLNSGIASRTALPYGFKEFPNERAVLKQWSPVAGVDLMMTQYGTRT